MQSHPAVALNLLRIDGIDTYQAHYQVEVAFTLTLVLLAAHGVWYACQEGGQAVAEIVQSSFLQLRYGIVNP